MTERMLTTEEAAEVLHRSPRTLEGWRYREEGPPYYRTGGSVVYALHELKYWLRQQRRTRRLYDTPAPKASRRRAPQRRAS